MRLSDRKVGRYGAMKRADHVILLMQDGDAVAVLYAIHLLDHLLNFIVNSGERGKVGRLAQAIVAYRVDMNDDVP